MWCSLFGIQCNEMWFLQNTRDAALHLSLPAGKGLIVGRKNCDVVIPGDQSISRRHAIVHIQENTKTSQVFLTDCKSKFGTIINGRKLSTGQKTALSIGDELKFGQAPLTGNFTLVFEPLVFCCSGMAGSDKTKVKQLVKRLGGSHVSSWSTDCTHLVMSTLTVTIKVVSALSTCRPIVTPSWLEAAVQCVQEGKPLPDACNFQPRVVDTNLSGNEEVSFRPDFSRKRLFQDRTFYFLSEKQHSSLNQCVQAAGARCVLCETPNSVALEGLVVKESLVLAVDDKHMELLSEDCRSWIKQVEEFLRSYGFRSILDSEIGFALLHMSIQKYCNPKSNEAESHAMPVLPAPSLSQMPHSVHTFTQDLPPSPSSQPHSSTHSRSNVTILAPDSELSTMAHSVQVLPRCSSQDSNKSDTSIVKVKESFMLPPKSSPVKRNTASANSSPAKSVSKPSSNSKNKAKQTLDVLFDNLSQEEVRSKLNPSNRGPLTSTQMPGGADPPSDAPVPKSISSESSLVDDSQPDHLVEAKDTSVLPGLKSRTSFHEVSIIGTKSQCEILAPQSLESNRSSQDVSILAPNSIGTPISQEKSLKKKDSLPDALMMTKLFQGRRKKRGIKETTDAATIEPIEKRPTKKQCLEKELSQKNGESEQLFGVPKNKKTRPRQPDKEQDIVMIDDEVNGSDGSKNNDKEAAKTNCEGSRNVNGELFKTPTKPNIRDKFSRPLDSVADINQPQKDAPHTPKKTVTSLSLGGSSTPFLSTRKRKRSTKEENTNENEAGATNGSKPTSQVVLTTPFTQLASMDATNAVVTPSSTILNTGGKRTKVRTADDEIWAEEPSGLDGENPLGSQIDVAPTRIYKPVYTEDGFIEARTKPKLQVSRMRRFGFRANLDLLTSPSSEEKSRDDRATPSQPAVHVEIETVSLICHDRVSVVDLETDEVDGVAEGTGRNFKKFRKVQNVTRGIPRFMSLMQYVPETNNTLQDWEVMDEEEVDNDTRVEESSQDMFKFTTRKRRK